MIFSPTMLEEMATFTFQIVGRIPGLNEIIGANRAHRMAGANLKKKTDAHCSQQIQLQKVPSFTGAVKIHFRWFHDFRRDNDNVRVGAKFILDSLVNTGKLIDDRPTYIPALSDDFVKDKNERTEITITDWTPATL